MRSLLATLACALVATANARTCPAKPIRMIVPYDAGGTSDTL